MSENKYLSINMDISVIPNPNHNNIPYFIGLVIHGMTMAWSNQGLIFLFKCKKINVTNEKKDIPFVSIKLKRGYFSHFLDEKSFTL